ncbi:hypothetical protein F5146DRAFT_677813 [Armillaria mellea]|nr:hypothetical protein F5146DRAFT_677813 [Armillaria mellea]
MAVTSDNRHVIVLPTCLVTSFLLATSLSAYTYSALRKELLAVSLQKTLPIPILNWLRSVSVCSVCTAQTKRDYCSAILSQSE